MKSLRIRLVVGAAVWSILALSIAGAAIVVMFAESVRRDQLEDLGASLDVLTVEFARAAPNPEAALHDPRYATPGSGLYYQVRFLDTNRIQRSRSLWDTVLILPEPDVDDDLLVERVGPDGQSLATLVRDVQIPLAGGLQHLRLAVAENATVRGYSIRDFAMQIVGALAMVAVVLCAAAWLAVQVGLRPIRILAEEIEEIRAGKQHKLNEMVPREFAPLVSEVNSLIDLHERGVQLTRERADDLAHGLKTPLAVMRATTDRLRDAGDVANASALELLSQEMAERIDYQLRLSQLRIRSTSRGFGTSVDQALLRSVAVIRKTGTGAGLHWHLRADRVTADIDSHDLMELVGVLLENAASWAKSEVVVSCRSLDGTAEFTLADDGPGLSGEQIAQLGVRGKRLDETRSGTGFGIAIAKEIVQLNAGSISFAAGPDGAGLRVVVTLPLGK